MNVVGEAAEREKHSIVPTGTLHDDDDEVDDPTTTIFQHKVLEEVFTSDYDVTQEEVLEYCDVIGIDPSKESHLIPLARTALYQPIPRPWTPVEDSRVGLYFFNTATGESSWSHPVDAIVRALVDKDRNKSKPCTADSCSEDLNTEEDLISELLKGEVSSGGDLTHSDCDINSPSKYLTTALTLAEQCLQNTAKPRNKSSIHSVPLIKNDRYEDGKELNVLSSREDLRYGDDRNFSIQTQNKNEGDIDSVKNNCDRKEVKRDSELKVVVDSANELTLTKPATDNARFDVEVFSFGPSKNSQAEIGKKVAEETLPLPEEEDYSSSIRLTPPDGAECTEASKMLYGRDGLAGGLSKSTLGPPPLGNPQSLGGLAPLSSLGGRSPRGGPSPLGGPPPLRGPSPLGSTTPLGGPPPLGSPAPLGGPPPLGSPAPLGSSGLLGRAPSGGSSGGSFSGARIPPVGGHLTPLAPIAAAAAGRAGQAPQLSPLKSPAGSVSRQSPSKNEARTNPPLQRQAQQQEKKGNDWSDAPKKDTLQKGGRQQGDGESAAVSGSPPRSILKGPVIAGRGAPRDRTSGLDRLSLMEPKESKNIRFEFETDDMEFHSSEEDFNDEELEEELEEEEEYEEEEEEEEEEEFDSEAEDPEEEAMIRARGLIDDDSELGNFMVNDAADLMPLGPGPPKQDPSGEDPWKVDDPNVKSVSSLTNKNDPLSDFKKQKDSNADALKATLTNEKVNRPKSAINQQPASQQQKPPVSQATRSEMGNVKKNVDVKPPEERKLELEGTPKNRKVNPLDRVVAKLSGRTENVNANQIKIDAATVVPSVATKNLTVNLTELMKQEESEEEESQVMDYPTPSQPPQKAQDAVKPTEKGERNFQTEQEQKLGAAKQREEEEKRLRSEQEMSLKLLRDQLDKEYNNLRAKVRQEHDAAIKKLEDQEKERNEKLRKELVIKYGEENQKMLEAIKGQMEKELAEKKSKIMKELQVSSDEEIEAMKLEFVAEMQQKKEKLQEEHEEEMQDLQSELKSLYSKEKNAVQTELETAQTAAMTRNKAAAEAAIADLERNMAEVLRDRQCNIKRDHNKHLAILSEELDKELEHAARQAKEKETMEKRSHSENLSRLKEDHQRSLQELQESHKQNLERLEIQHEEDLAKLKSDFKAELTIQKTELENKLTNLRIEYEQQMTTIGHEHIIEGTEDEEERESNTSRRANLEKDKDHKNEGTAKSSRDKLNVEEQKYDQILKELRERRESLENDLEELKTQESQVKELKNKTLINNTSCCSGTECVHEMKYHKMKAKYSNLVSRIKSEKAKKSVRKLSFNPSGHNGESISCDKSSTVSNANVSDAGQRSDDLVSSISSPQHLQHPGYYMKSTSDASEDEELRIATQVLEKYSKMSEIGGGRNISHSSININLKSHSTKPLTSTPKKAWMEDDLLAHGRRELVKTEKFLKLNHVQNHKDIENLHADDIQREISRQNASFEVPRNNKVSSRRLSLGPGGSLTSDTEESDEPTHDAPSSSSDFGLDQILAKISSTSKISAVKHHRHQSTKEKHRPLRAASSLERGLNDISDSYHQTHSRAGYNSLSRNAPLRVDHLQIGSAPDLGPETVDRIASVNQYLQQRWTNYFGELRVPLGGKVGWPSQVIGQSTIFAGKSDTQGVQTVSDKRPTKNWKNNSTLLDGKTLGSLSQQDHLSQKIEDLRAWLNNAQAIAAKQKDK